MARRGRADEARLSRAGGRRIDEASATSRTPRNHPRRAREADMRMISNAALLGTFSPLAGRRRAPTPAILSPRSAGRGSGEGRRHATRARGFPGSAAVAARPSSRPSPRLAGRRRAAKADNPLAPLAGERVRVRGRRRRDACARNPGSRGGLRRPLIPPLSPLAGRRRAPKPTIPSPRLRGEGQGERAPATGSARSEQTIRACRP